MVEMKNKKIKTSLKKKQKKSSSRTLCLKKTKMYQNLIQDTILYVQKYKTLDVLDAGELNICIQSLEKLYIQTNEIVTILSGKKSLIDFNNIIERLQNINNDLSVNFRLYGTKNIDDVLNICFGNEYIAENIVEENRDLFEVIKKYTHPINYKILDWKENTSIKNKKEAKKKLAKNRIIEDFMLVETAVTMDCFDLARTTKKFQTKVYGIKICFQNPQKRKTMIISAITDDMVINCMNLQYLANKLNILNKNKPTDPVFIISDFSRFCEALTLKELLVYSCQELYQRYMGYVNQANLIKKKNNFSNC